jgi:hypothetical protein
MKFGALASMAFVLFIGMAVASMAGLAPDADADGRPDVIDNCTLVKNVTPAIPGGCDVDQDGYGNICDSDYNEDGTVDGVDFGVFKTAFSKGTDAGNGTDQNCDGTVDGVDFGVFKNAFKTGTVGPSGLGCANPGAAGSCPNAQ